MAARAGPGLPDDEFAVPDDVRPLVDRVQEFIEREVEPVEDEYREYLGDPLSSLDDEGRLRPEVEAARAEIRERSGEAGLYALHMPESVGGGGLSQREHFYVSEEIFRYGTGHGTGLTKAMLAWTEGPAPMLTHLDQDQRERWLDPLVAGRETTCFAATEPGAGSDVPGISTRAEREGDEYVLNGRKQYITNAVHADTAQILAKTDQAEGTAGMAVFMLEVDNPGIEVGRVNRNIMMDGMTAELVLDDCRVGADQMVGDVGDGLPLALNFINWRRVGRGGMCVGMGRYLLDRMVEHATTREAFGAPIAANQAVQWPIVETATEIHAVRAFSLRMLDDIDDLTSLDALEHPPAALRRMSMLKYYAENRLFDWSDRAIQVLGGHGLMREGGVERVFRVARNLRIPAGTTEMQKRTIAETMGLEE
jgi:alkylation response protein AidB-like acyl-CoA dehydrogenase